MRFPNLYIPLEGSVTERPAVYFLDGEQLTYTVQIDDESIASATLANGLLTVRGLKRGFDARLDHRRRTDAVVQHHRPQVGKRKRMALGCDAAER